MNALEFFAKITSYSGYEDNGEEITVLLPRGEDNEFLLELVVWSALCPDLDAVYVMHDFIPVYNEDAELSFTFAFLLKDNKITCIKDEKEVKRLYEEYHAKYPCDTSEVEDDINSWYGSVSKFYF